MALIRNYGLRWQRDMVFWGSAGSGNKGTLLGVAAKSPQIIVDFRDQIAIYALYDKNFVLVYAGQVGGGSKSRLFKRLHQHRSDALKNRWNYFSWFGLKSINKDNILSEKRTNFSSVKISVPTLLNNLEGILIHLNEPKHNIQAARWQNSAREFWQYSMPEER